MLPGLGFVLLAAIGATLGTHAYVDMQAHDALNPSGGCCSLSDVVNSVDFLGDVACRGAMASF